MNDHDTSVVVTCPRWNVSQYTTFRGLGQMCITSRRTQTSGRGGSRSPTRLSEKFVNNSSEVYATTQGSDTCACLRALLRNLPSDTAAQAFGGRGGGASSSMLRVTLRKVRIESDAVQSSLSPSGEISRVAAVLELSPSALARQPGEPQKWLNSRRVGG